jgi:ATP-dependent RNA helicase DDX56/DBP9
MMEVINLDSNEVSECLAKLKGVKGMSRVVISTPSNI